MKSQYSELPAGYGKQPKQPSWLNRQIESFVTLSIPACAAFLIVWAVQALHPIPAYCYGILSGFFFIGNVVLRTSADIARMKR